MSQREKEETEFKVPDALILCVNNCGFPGNPATKNMCQSCYKSAGVSTPSSCSGHDTQHIPAAIRSPERSILSAPAVVSEERPSEQADPPPPPRQVNRCSRCRKKVGLTGFRCRCGDLFCGTHRYSDRHECSFDYRAAGRDAIARENPLVKAAKIVRV